MFTLLEAPPLPRNRRPRVVVKDSTFDALLSKEERWDGAIAGGMSSSAEGEREKRITEALQAAVILVHDDLVAAQVRGDIH